MRYGQSLTAWVSTSAATGVMEREPCGRRAGSPTDLDALYEGRPEGTLISITEKPKGWRPHFVHSPADALPYVLGGVDVYDRVTPLRERPAKGRGGADLAASLPGVWADLDVTGSPDSNGGQVKEAAPSLQAAVKLARAVIEPTLLVGSATACRRSGYSTSRSCSPTPATATVRSDSSVAGSRGCARRPPTRGWADSTPRMTSRACCGRPAA